MSTILRHADAGSLAADVATRLLELLEAVQAEGRVPAVALTGGTIADEIHREVARLAEDSSVDWSRVDVFWGDERFVEATSPDRNALQARESLLAALPFDPARIHEVPAADTGLTLEQAAKVYGDAVRAHGGGEFDLVMLGVGPDGHVASLFPGYPQLDVDDTIAVAVTDSPKPPPERVSLTFPALNRSRAVWFVVSGEGKATAVARAVEGSAADRHVTPAAAVHGRLETLWFVDDAAASHL